MSQKNWDKYEVALLIEAYQNIKQGRVDKNTALVALSQNLRQMAQNEGLEIDDVFRNLNGMQWQLGFIERAFLGSDFESRTPPKIFVEMVAVYNENRQEYLSILKCAHEKITQQIKDDVIGPRTDVSLNEESGNVKPPYARVASLPFDIHLPLYQILGVKSPESYNDVSIEAIGLNKKTNDILTQDGRVSVEDVLRCSIAQIFDLHLIARSAIGKIVSKIKSFISYDVKSLDAKLYPMVPFVKLFSVEESEQYKGFSIGSIKFSVRFYNVLMRNNVTDLYSLLNLSIDDLRKLKGLGDNSIFESVKILYNFLKNPNKKIVNKQQTSVHNIAELTKVKGIINSILLGETVDISLLSEKQKSTLEVYLQAIEESGKEFYYTVLDNPDVFKAITDRFSVILAEYRSFVRKKEELYTIFSEIHGECEEIFVKFLADAYYITNNDSLRSFWNELPEECLLEDFWRYVCIHEDELKTNIQDLEKFFRWVKKLDLSKLVEQIFSKEALGGQYKVDNALKDKYLVVLEMRAAGDTLEDIGKVIDATRERVRQIEKKYTKQFALYYKNNQYDLLAIIRALRGGDYVLRFDEVEAQIGKKYTQLLWLVLSKGLLDNRLYKFSNKYNAVIFASNKEDEKEKLHLAVQAIPAYFSVEQLESIVDSVAEDYNVHKELLQMDVQSKFRLYGTIYSKDSITVPFMCGYILKNKYPSGFKIGVEEETNRFSEYLRNTFGEKGSMTNRAIEAKIGEVGVLCDRGKYIHADFIQVDKSVVDAINEYIHNSSKIVLTYSEIFDSMRAVFDGTQITNRFILQGILKQYGCKFTMTRDYISKESGKSLTDEFEDFAKSRGEFSKLDFFAEFPSMTEANLAMLLGRSKDVFGVDFGIYMHASLLNLIETDYSEISKYLNAVCADIPVDARFLYDEFSTKFIDFMSRNEVNGYNKLFGILSYIFDGEFIFSRPYISKNESVNLSKKAIILRRLEDYEIITIDEVIDICNENGLRYGSVPNLIKMVTPEFVRINETTLMRLEQAGITDEIIIKVTQQIEELIESNNYYSSSIIDDFLFFPQLSIIWNPYLLESVIDLSGDRIHVIKIPMKSYTTLTYIFVGEEYAEDDYQTFILKVLDEAYSKAFFTTKSEMREWLSERGLITNNSLPNFLEGTNYYFMDDNGVLRKRG